MAMATTSKQVDLKTTPVRDWPPQALMKEAALVARYWGKLPAFCEQNCGIFSDVEDRASEIVVRVLGYIKKRGADESGDQVTRFHEIARYCQPGMIQDSFAIPPKIESKPKNDHHVEDDGDGGDEVEIKDLDYASPEDVEDAAERARRIEALLQKIGITARDRSLFDTTGTDFVESTGLCERQFRVMKSARKAEILAKLNASLRDELSDLMPSLAI